MVPGLLTTLTKTTTIVIYHSPSMKPRLSSNLFKQTNQARKDILGWIFLVVREGSRPGVPKEQEENPLVARIHDSSPESYFLNASPKE